MLSGKNANKNWRFLSPGHQAGGIYLVCRARPTSVQAVGQSAAALPSNRETDSKTMIQSRVSHLWFLATGRIDRFRSANPRSPHVDIPSLPKYNPLSIRRAVPVLNC